MAQFEDWFGLAGVAWLSGCSTSASSLTLWTIARRYASPLGAAPVTVVAILASSAEHVHAPAGAAATSSSPSRRTPGCAPARTGSARWWLVPLAWLWAMVHGMWSVGIIIGLVALRRPRPRPGRLARASGSGWPRSRVLSAVAAALTPVGPALYRAVLEVNGRGQYFAEWQPPDFRDPNCIALLILVGLVLLRWSRRRTSCPVDRGPARRCWPAAGRSTPTARSRSPP